MLRIARLLVLALPLVSPATAALASANHFGLTISTDSTYNVSFSNGVFTATGDRAILNINDLENALAGADTEVTTDNGSGGNEKGDLHVEATLSWTSASALTLDAFHSIFVDQPIANGGAGGLTLTNNDGGSDGVLSILGKGSIVFDNLSNQLTINGAAYMLVSDISSLATAIKSNPAGNYALANSYDASLDGTYSKAPIRPNFKGTLDGLGNTISNLRIRIRTIHSNLALFNDVDLSGSVEHLHLSGIRYVSASSDNTLSSGGLAGALGGTLFQDSVSGRIDTPELYAVVGGLVAGGGGRITQCSAAVDIEEGSYGYAGGLVGMHSAGTITESFSSGSISTGNSSIAGGLVGWGPDAGGYPIAENSYATGSVSGGLESSVGGVVGISLPGASGYEVYATGVVSGSGSSFIGGFAGKRMSRSKYTNAYWDTTTSGTSNATGKGSSRGIEGLTTEQLQSGLPAGFDPAVWVENPKINGGLPYLIHNPPSK